MIFLGDIACPSEREDMFISSIIEQCVFDNKVIVANYEAVILKDDDSYKDGTLYNSVAALRGFDNTTKMIVSLANNHMYDYPDRILYTRDTLESQGIGVFGLCNEDGSFSPYEYSDENGNKSAFFGHCWSLYTKTNTNSLNNVRIVDCGYDVFIKEVRKYKMLHEDTKVYCMMHWNYDLEKIPLPMHRRVSHALIDAGAEAVIGSHAHVPQGVELYKEHLIAYGLGNFYLPSGIYFNGKLKYPLCSHVTYGVDVKESKIIWFNTDGVSPIEYVNSESYHGEKIEGFSKFIGMDHTQYISFYKKYRSKKMVPVFDDYTGMNYKTKELFMLIKVKLIRLMKY